MYHYCGRSVHSLFFFTDSATGVNQTLNVEQTLIPTTTDIDSSEIESSSEISSVDDAFDVEKGDDTETDDELFEVESQLPVGKPTTYLYEGSQITVFDSYLLAFHYGINNGLTTKAFNSLLQMLSLFAPQDSPTPRSVYKLKKVFINMFPHSLPKTHYYCDVCCAKTTREATTCTTSGCHGRKKHTFLSMPLGPQIKKMMEGTLSCSKCMHII